METKFHFLLAAGVLSIFAVCAYVLRIERVEAPTIPAGWLVATSSSASFAYPPTLTEGYIHTIDWPPRLVTVDGPYSCTEGGASEALPAGKTKEETIQGHTYCVTRESEGAAGSVYTMYAYAFSHNSKRYILTFSLQAVQCANYDEPNKSACQAERDAFNPGVVVDAIAATIR